MFPTGLLRPAFSDIFTKPPRRPSPCLQSSVWGTPCDPSGSTAVAAGSLAVWREGTQELR